MGSGSMINEIFYCEVENSKKNAQSSISKTLTSGILLSNSKSGFISNGLPCLQKQFINLKFTYKKRLLNLTTIKTKAVQRLKLFHYVMCRLYWLYRQLPCYARVDTH